MAPLALIAALFADAETLALAGEACRPAADRWQQATEVGLADRALAQAARELAAIGESAVARLHLGPGDPREVRRLLDRRLRQGISPAADHHGTDVTGQQARS
jgi:glutamate--cysteine ligase